MSELEANNQARPEFGATEHVFGALAAYALDALESDEARAVARHLDACATCRAELARYREAAEALPYAAEPLTVPLRARAHLLQRIDALGARNPRQAVLASNAPQPRRLTRLGGMRRAWIALVPAAILVLAFGANAFFMQDRIDSQRDQINTLEADKGKLAQVLVPVDNTTRYVTELNGSTYAPQARARLFLDREANDGVLLAISLRELTDGSSYVAWLHAPGAWERLGVLTLDKQGRSQMSITPQQGIDTYDSFVVTLETDADVTAPSGPVILSGTTVPQTSIPGTLAWLR